MIDKIVYTNSVKKLLANPRQFEKLSIDPNKGLNFIFKGTLLQIWKFVKISVFIWQLYVECFTWKHHLLFEICASERCEKFVYKHSVTTEYVKNYPTFQGIYKRHGQITQEFLGLILGNFQGTLLILKQRYREIFKSALVYL